MAAEQQWRRCRGKHFALKTLRPPRQNSGCGMQLTPLLSGRQCTPCICNPCNKVPH